MKIYYSKGYDAVTTGKVKHFLQIWEIMEQFPEIPFTLTGQFQDGIFDALIEESWKKPRTHPPIILEKEEVGDLAKLIKD